MPIRSIANEHQYHVIREATHKQIDACFQLLDRHMENRIYIVENRHPVFDPYLFVFCRWGKSLPNPFTNYPNLHRFLMQMADDAGVQRAMQAQRITL